MQLKGEFEKREKALRSEGEKIVSELKSANKDIRDKNKKLSE